MDINAIKAKPPCKDCPNRTMTCHDDCELYNEWAKKRLEANRELYNVQAAEYMADSIAHKRNVINQIYWQKKRSRTKTR